MVTAICHSDRVTLLRACKRCAGLVFGWKQELDSVVGRGDVAVMEDTLSTKRTCVKK